MKSIFKPFAVLVFGIAFIPGYLSAQTKTGFHVIADYPIHSTGGWDYITVDGSTNRVYTSHGMQVNILNAATGDSVGY
ncbi:MAG: hypothetical protein M3N14_02640, partial [Bacteroidota bacterium]|nr:hypothetical protein [Bacteroidota bacterium]